jgi:hypothetical protein
MGFLLFYAKKIDVVVKIADHSETSDKYGTGNGGASAGECG